MIKFTDEMLSRALTAHANGGLVRGGRFNKVSYPGCLYQVALEIDSFCDIKERPIPGFDPECDANLISVFDKKYNPNWTAEEFIQFLASNGVM